MFDVAREKPSLETYLQFGEISFLLAKVGQLEEIRRNFPKFPPLPTYPQFAELRLVISGIRFIEHPAIKLSNSSDVRIVVVFKTHKSLAERAAVGSDDETVTDPHPWPKGMCLHDRDPASPEPVYFPSGLSLSTTDSYDANEFIDSDTEGTFCAYFQCSEHHISSEQVFESLSQTMVEEEQAGFRPNYVATPLLVSFIIVHAALRMLAKQVHMYHTPHAGRHFPMQTSDSVALEPLLLSPLLGFPGGSQISQMRTVPGEVRDQIKDIQSNSGQFWVNWRQCREIAKGGFS
ncbi:hypothetical protein C8R45DRAFT_931645 [Mycena sanguinolenta]|nr:hypothetical protein C8R45DRAFT_931645 [Mycena sanguinolenta]